MKQILTGLKREHDGERIPSVLFTKGGGLWLESIAESGCDALGLDWTINIAEARNRVGHKVALQGNLDPAILFSTPEVITTEVEKILKDYGSGSGHVFNLGHGISQFTPPESALTLINAVHSLSKKYHS